MDVLTDVLRATSMANTVMCQARFSAPWGIIVDPSVEATAHVIQRGSCWLRLPDRAPVQLSDGDIVLLARGAGHLLSSGQDSPVRPLAEVLERQSRQAGIAPGAETAILCAKYYFDAPSQHPVLSRLPELVHLRSAEAARNSQLQLLIQLMRSESEFGGEGSDLVVPRLVDSLFVFTIRAWMESVPGIATNWFSAMRDLAIGRALTAIHAEPSRKWTLDALAAVAGQSRATFARRFHALVGETPVAYLLRWRLCLAARALRDGAASVASVGYLAGFSSPEAFSRAFKRQFGQPPLSVMGRSGAGASL